MNLNLYRQASDLEDTNPEEALKIYKKLEHENSEFHISILLAAIISFIVAFVIAFFVSQSMSSYRTIATIIIMSSIGFLPPSLMYATKLVRQRKRCMGVTTSRPSQVIAGAFMAIGAIYVIVIQIVILVIIAAITSFIILALSGLVNHLLTGAPFLWSPEPNEPLFWVCFVIVFLIVASDVSLWPIFPVRRKLMQIPIGLKVNYGNILRFIAVLAIVLVIYRSGPLAFLYKDIRLGVIASGFSGVLFSFTFGRWENDPPLANLYRFARARCLIRLGRQAEADLRLTGVLKGEKLFLSEAAEKLGIALWSIINDPPEVERYINEAAKCVSSNDRYLEIYLDNIQKTRRLVGLEDKGDLPKRMMCGKHLGVGRVLETGYAYQEGAPRGDYNPDNPTGYMTGQWINVEVLEGKMYFNKWYGPGEIIRGVWSYGGDVGIVGKPKVGDLVGYYAEGYAKIWEKVSNNSVREKRVA